MPLSRSRSGTPVFQRVPKICYSILQLSISSDLIILASALEASGWKLDHQRCCSCAGIAPEAAVNELFGVPELLHMQASLLFKWACMRSSSSVPKKSHVQVECCLAPRGGIFPLSPRYVMTGCVMGFTDDSLNEPDGSRQHVGHMLRNLTQRFVASCEVLCTTG